MKGEKENQADGDKKEAVSDQEYRPKKGLEDWEMLQEREEPPLKIPFWLPILIGGLLLAAILLTFPFMGVRAGYERPWLDWGLLIGAGYGVFSLIVIYFFMKKRKNAADEAKVNEDKK